MASARDRDSQFARTIAALTSAGRLLHEAEKCFDRNAYRAEDLGPKEQLQAVTGAKKELQTALSVFEGAPEHIYLPPGPLSLMRDLLSPLLHSIELELVKVGDSADTGGLRPMVRFEIQRAHKLVGQVIKELREAADDKSAPPWALE